MKSSISTRIWRLASLVVAAVIVLCAGFFWSVRQSQEAERWVDHTQTVLRKLSSHELFLAQAESAQRGFLIAHDPGFVAAYHRALAERADRFAQLQKLTADDAAQKARLARMEGLVRQRVDVLARAMAAGQAGDFEAGRAIVREGQGAALMDSIAALSGDMADTEKALLAQRKAQAQRHARLLGFAVLLGGGVLLFIVVGGTISTILRIKRPLDRLLHGITALAEGALEQQVEVDTQDEIGRVAEAFNRMARRLREATRTREAAEQEVARTNAELRRRSDLLVERGRAIDLLGKMAHRLQAVTSEAEFARIVQRFAPRILPGTGGALYLLNNSRNLVTLAAAWNCGADLSAYFAPGECWALRRGQAHAVADGAEDILCDHVGEHPRPYICTPLLAHGETIGLLYVERMGETGGSRLPLLVENIALALANYNLKQSLREQSIRDPLTGLFNRRYLEESLGLELARAMRGGTPLGVMMLDVDHFKRFNDEFGHEAGDALLRALGRELPAHVRAGDLVCRYGGEELTVILPGADAELTRQRAEAIRAAVAALMVAHLGQPLGQVTISIGVAALPEHGLTGEALLAAADRALYRAKALGRNQVQTAEPMPLAA